MLTHFLALLLALPNSYALDVMARPSQIAYYINTGLKGCPTLDLHKANLALSAVEQCQTGAQAHATALGAIQEFEKANQASVDDRFFEPLVRQHNKDLKCSADFAGKIGSGDLDGLHDLTAKVRLLRLARQDLVKSTAQLIDDPKIANKTCPSSLDDLKPNPIEIAGSGSDANYILCGKIMRARLATQMVITAIPISAVPSVNSLLEKYANAPDGPEADAMTATLPRSLEQAYAAAKSELLGEANRLQKTLDTEGGAGFSRDNRHALLSDPRTVAKVLHDSGDDPDLSRLACRENARYKDGADALNTDIFVGSLLATEGVGVVMKMAGPILKAGKTASEAIDTAEAARSAGMLSTIGKRVFQLSALGGVGASSYAILKRACGVGELNDWVAAGTDPNGSCLNAPTVKALSHESCILAKMILAVGAGSAVLSAALTLPIVESRVTALGSEIFTHERAVEVVKHAQTPPTIAQNELNKIGNASTDSRDIFEAGGRLGISDTKLAALTAGRSSGQVGILSRAFDKIRNDELMSPKEAARISGALDDAAAKGAVNLNFTGPQATETLGPLKANLTLGRAMNAQSAQALVGSEDTTAVPATVALMGQAATAFAQDKQFGTRAQQYKIASHKDMVPAQLVVEEYRQVGNQIFITKASLQKIDDMNRTDRQNWFLMETPSVAPGFGVPTLVNWDYSKQTN